MKAILRKSKISGDLASPPSKSYTHRAISIALLSEKSEILFPLLSEDTKATINAAKALGADVEYKEKGKKLTIEGVMGRPKTPDDVINAANSGTTLRFFIAISSLCDGAAVLTGDASLRKRPNFPLLKALNELGSEVFSTKKDGTAPIVVKGKLKGGKTTIDASISSQFISALLIACPLAEKNSYITTTNLVSKPYIRMTLEILKKAGVNIRFYFPNLDGTGLKEAKKAFFEIEKIRKYDLRSFTVPGDYSSSSFLLAAAAATNSEVVISNLCPSAQGDEKIVEILKDMGANIKWDKEKGVIKVKGAQLKGIEVDLHDTPDLVPIIAVLGAISEGTTEITNIGHLRYKETNRLDVIAKELRRMDAKIGKKEESLLIEGKKALKGAKVYSHSDHRMAMALSIAALSADGETEIEGVDCINVSYPSFFEHLLHLDADIKLL